jgi:hypothetical protein
MLPCLKSLQIAMDDMSNNRDISEFKKEIASALRRSIYFYNYEYGFLKTHF